MNIYFTLVLGICPKYRSRQAS